MTKRICTLTFFILFSIFLLGEGAIFDFDNKVSAATVQGTIRITICGNNIKETGEQCDNADLGGASCASLGYTGGTLSCTPACDFNTSACTSVCGNNIKETGEQCDGADLGGASCISQGYTGGTLSCTPACGFNTSACSSGGGGGGGGITPVNGACGTSNGLFYYATPTINLCNAGNSSVVAGSGPWTWTCNGLYGGSTSPQCTANKALNPPAGCTSTLGYSITTGLPCSGASLVTPPTTTTTTTSTACINTNYITKYIKLGAANNPAEVNKLQIFLRDYEGFSSLSVTGIYDQATYNAVKQFQLKYAADILTPWGITAPSGWVYITTKKKINQLYCQSQSNNQIPNLFAQPLGYGSNNQQVVLLQNTLKNLGFFPKSIGSNGNFGPITLKAVQDFQVYYNIAQSGVAGYGQVGPKTRQELNQLINQ
jgi:peptidoglycan hydrolase-like protein with peptidoglycan-binding domain